VSFASVEFVLIKTNYVFYSLSERKEDDAYEKVKSNPI